MAILRHIFYDETGVELEMRLSPAPGPSLMFNEHMRKIGIELIFRYGPSYPEISLEYLWPRGYLDSMIKVIPPLAARKRHGLIIAPETEKYMNSHLSIWYETDFPINPDEYFITYRHIMWGKKADLHEEASLDFRLCVSKDTLLKFGESLKVELEDAVRAHLASDAK